jgi:hypothetical protein
MTTPISSRRLARAGVLAAGASAAIVLGTFAQIAWADTATHVLAANDIPTVIGNIRTWLMGILVALATLFLTIGGVRYLIAAGDPGEVEKAKTCFKSAAIGYCLAILAPVVITILQGIVGSN